MTGKDIAKFLILPIGVGMTLGVVLLFLAARTFVH